ncbi:hypothetical protein Tco_1365117, partial [Tanacetum coccineum]
MVMHLKNTVIHMLVERRYPLSKDLLQRMLDLGLEVERESTVALDLIRFIKQNRLMKSDVVNGLKEKPEKEWFELAGLVEWVLPAVLRMCLPIPPLALLLLPV